MNYRKAWELNNTFHYTRLLLSIVLESWELLEDSQFPLVALGRPEAAKYASLWVTKDVQRIKDNKIFWILMDMNICMAINRKLWLSPMAFSNMRGYAEFKVYFHHVSIRACKQFAQIRYNLPYLATDYAIDAVLDHWPTKWITPANLVVGGSKSATQCKKEEAKLKMKQLTEKRKKEAADKA